MSIEAECIICRHRQTVKTFGDWVCAECQQSYSYDEGHGITLTDAQVGLLRAAKASATDQPVVKESFTTLQPDGTPGNIPFNESLKEGWKQVRNELIEEGIIPFKSNDKPVDYPSDFIDALAYDLAVRDSEAKREVQQPVECHEAFEKWVVEKTGDLYAPVSALDAWEAAWNSRPKRDPAGCVACGHSFEGHYDSCRYSKREMQQPVGLLVSDIELAIKNAQPERIIVRQELRQRDGEPIEILDDKIEYRVTPLQQAAAVLEAIRPYLRQPERETVTLCNEEQREVVEILYDAYKGDCEYQTSWSGFEYAVAALLEHYDIRRRGSDNA